MNSRRRSSSPHRKNNSHLSKVDTTPFSLEITNLSHDGRGIGRHQGKAVFVEGALPSETVEVIRTKQNSKMDEAKISERLSSSEQRTEPPCPHFERCGGCDLQHLTASAQVEHKASHVLSQLSRIGKVTPTHLESPISGNDSGYRRSARIGVNQGGRDGRLIMGFRRKQSNKLTDIDQCYVLETRLNAFLEKVRPILEAYEAARNISHIQLASLDQCGAVTFRTVKQVDDEVLSQCANAANALTLNFYVDNGESLLLIGKDQGPLTYSPGFDLKLEITPSDFFQVNADINKALVATALDWLHLEPTDHVLDLFCGSGNFSLPIAKHTAHLTGVEGNDVMVQRAKHNAKANGLDQCEFFQADLTSDLRKAPWYNKPFTKILLDPPRTGAAEIVTNISQYGASDILYVSCNPSALARDSAVLTQQGYQLERFCAVNMFPHTTHIESLALFKKVKKAKKVKAS